MCYKLTFSAHRLETGRCLTAILLAVAHTPVEREKVLSSWILICYYKCINEIAAMVGSLLDLIMQLLFSRRCSSCVLKFKLKSSFLPPLQIHQSPPHKMGLILIYLADGLVGAIFWRKQNPLSFFSSLYYSLFSFIKNTTSSITT